MRMPPERLTKQEIKIIESGLLALAQGESTTFKCRKSDAIRRIAKRLNIKIRTLKIPYVGTKVFRLD